MAAVKLSENIIDTRWTSGEYDDSVGVSEIIILGISDTHIHIRAIIQAENVWSATIIDENYELSIDSDNRAVGFDVKYTASSSDDGLFEKIGSFRIVKDGIYFDFMELEKVE